MKQKLILNFLPMTLNPYINAERGNKYAGAEIKKTETTKVAWAAKLQHIKPIKRPVRMHFTWMVKNKRKDPDNIAFAKKLILDGLHWAGILPNDNLNWIEGFCDDFVISKKEGVEIEFGE